MPPDSQRNNKTKAIRARIAHCTHAKAPDFGFEYLADGILLIEDGKITDLRPAQELEQQGFELSQCEHFPDSLLLPGFIDAHVHAGQLDVLGCYGEQLLDWLNNYTFPNEMRFANPEVSLVETQRFVDQLLSHGTTTAMVFPTSYKHSVDHLFQTAEEKGMRLIAGKVQMDRNAPEGLLDNGDPELKDTRELIKAWHGSGRLGYAITPRFAGTSTDEQLKRCGELLQEVPDLWMQTHLSENHAEIEWTAGLFPDAKDYLDCYDRYGLHTERSIFAHCIHLSDDEWQRIQDKGSAIAFCPSSNLFLGSGLFRLPEARRRHIDVAACSDVGGGTHLCGFRTLADAYKVCQMQNYSLSAREALYLITLGAAKAIKQDQFIGSLTPGKEADFILVNASSVPPMVQRLGRAKTIDEELFVYITMGDERLIERTYIAGQNQYPRI